MREIPGGGEPNQKPLKKDDFVVPAQQTERTEVFTAQHSGQEPERQTKENLPVAPRRTGSRPNPPESTPSGELYRGSLIRSLREEKGLSMQEVESQLGYARRSLSMIERNRFVPTQEKLEQLAEVLDVPVEALAQAPAHPRVKKGVPPGKAPQPPEFTETGEMYQGSLIRKLRLERGLDAADAAAQLGYAPTTLRRIETNNSFLSGGKLQQFAEVLEVPVEELAQAPMHPKAKKHVPRGYQQKPPEFTETSEMYRGSLIRLLRQDKGLTRQEVEAQLGVRPGYLSTMENNQGNPSAQKLQLLAQLLGVPVEELEQAPGQPTSNKKRVPPRKPQKPPEFTETGEMYLGSLIRKLRLERGLDNANAAAQLGYSLTSLSALETNHTLPSAQKLQKIAELLAVPVEALAQAPAHPRTTKRKGENK